MQNLIQFFKVWKNQDGSYSKKEYFFNADLPFEGLEACKVRLNGIEVDCTKIHYPGNFLQIVGTPFEFLETCRQGKVTTCILLDLYKENITIKQFMEQNERINGIQA
jgi:hypothetical protein